MKKVKIFWPTVVALFVAVSINSCQNEKLKKEYEEKHLLNIPDFSITVTDPKNIKPATEINLDQYKLEPIKTVEDYLKELEEEKEEETVQKTH